MVKGSIMDMVRITIFSLLFMTFVCGCAEEVTLPPSEPLCLTSADRTQIMEIAEDILVRMHFVIEKYDIDAGFIKTKPLSGAQYFEFWRKDNASSVNAVEANLHSIQRSVQLGIADNARGLCLKCDVNVKRLSIPEEEFLRMSQMGGTFTSGRAFKMSLRMDSEKAEEMVWIDLGPDPSLERKILSLIEQKHYSMEGK